MIDPIQVSMLAEQTLALAGLVWYTLETRRMRQASQQQVKISQDLISAAMAQVEGLSKPCLTLWSDRRDAADAISDINGAVGNTIARADAGSFVLQNIGNGVALNVSYQFKHLHPLDAPPRPTRKRYLPQVLPTARVTMVEPIAAYPGQFEVTFSYESIGGRKYESVVTMNNRVLTAFRFMELVPA